MKQNSPLPLTIYILEGNRSSKAIFTSKIYVIIYCIYFTITVFKSSGNTVHIFLFSVLYLRKIGSRSCLLGTIGRPTIFKYGNYSNCLRSS